MPAPERALTVEKLLEQGCEAFEKEYKVKPEVAACAPGRVNLIGEHLDYNDGFVLPMALPMVCILVGRKNNSKKIRLLTLESSSDKPNKVEFPVPSEKMLEPSEDPPRWVNYVKGTLNNFEGEIPGFDALVISSVPMGGGLSSSAALEVATYTFLEELTRRRTKNLVQKALSCQKAERNFVGMPCGIMDQFISVMGKEGAALLIDCRATTAHSVPVKSTEHVFLITNSNVRHELGSSQFALRVKQCAEAAQILNKKKLRDATLSDLEEAKKKGLIQDEIYRRAHHVITEIERTKKAAKALEAGNSEDFGKLMNESHQSLREDYEVTCPELNELVALASEVDGVLGSRMTGGGFGGCTVTLVEKEKVQDVVNHISEKYSRTPIFYVATPSPGARALSIASISEAEKMVPVDRLINDGCEAFMYEFGAKPTVAACAPGRVNLIGEHLDYNDGFVLPMALPMVTVLVGGVNDSNIIRIQTLETTFSKTNKVEFLSPSEKKIEPSKESPKWAEYVKGTIANFEGDIPGFNAVVISSVPIGSGLSSSAALEVATYTFLEAITQRKKEKLVEKVLACQRAEHDFVGMPCGVMDQFISVMGQKGVALLIDCRLNEAHNVPVKTEKYVFLITNSNVQHELGSSQFALRVKQCAEAAHIINKKKLRDATIEDLDEAKKNELMADEIYRRARHVITEIDRTRKGAKALEEGHLKFFGKLMYESHESLREDYEVSCAELNELVTAASEVDGVLGSKMTGGGFGGCTVTLVAKNKVHDVIDHIKKKYSKKPTFYVATPSSGAHTLPI